ncbi:Sperm-tail pg-rich repeat, partial [Globisporangium splendens]
MTAAQSGTRAGSVVPPASSPQLHNDSRHGDRRLRQRHDNTADAPPQRQNFRQVGIKPSTGAVAQKHPPLDSQLVRSVAVANARCTPRHLYKSLIVTLWCIVRVLQTTESREDHHGLGVGLAAWVQHGLCLQDQALQRLRERGRARTRRAPACTHRSQNRKYGMSSFANTPKAFTSNQAASAAEIPGPADYNTAQTSPTLAHNIARAAFSSKITRGFAPPTDVAAPGQYDNPIQLSQSLRKQHGSPQSIFKSASKRLDSGTTFTPGPGAYNAEDVECALRYDWIAKTHTSAAFQAGNLDRFGRVPGKNTLDSEIGVL